MLFFICNYLFYSESRTDFYYILQPNGKLGFKEGFVEAMTYGVC